MTYTPGIPNATDNISVSQGQIKTNFQQLETVFANDHYTWDDATSGGSYRGYHKQIYLPVASPSDPALGAFASVFFSKNDPNDSQARPQLYFKNVTTTYQVTNRFTGGTASSYFSMGLGGTIFMWGSLAVNTSGQYAISFPTITNYIYTTIGTGPNGFPNNLINVTFSLKSPSSVAAPPACIDSGNGLFTTQGFTLRIGTSVANTTAYWQAIGN